MKQDSFTGRYIIKLSSSIILAALNAFIQLFLPRVLTVEGYGYYSYNLNIFTSIVIMINLSTSSAMIAKFSRRNQEEGILIFYLKYLILASIFLNVIISILSIFMKTELFHNQILILILLGLNAAIFNKFLSDIISMYDALAISRFPAAIQIILKLFICLFVYIGYFLGSLSLELFYIIQIITTGISVFILYKFLRKNQIERYSNIISKNNKEYIKEFWKFCKPLILTACWSQFNIIVMNWALMNYSGEKNQAMFGIALQLNILLSYIFSPYAELLKREFAVIVDDKKKLKLKFIQALKQMFWVTSYFSVFTLIFADWIILFLFGESYKEAILVTQIMMIYTIYQAWGQIIGSYMLATEQTTRQAILSSVNLFLNLILIFLFQVPNIIFKNGLGSEGIALNYTLCNVISTLISVYYCINTLKEKQKIQLKTQILAILSCTSIAIIVKELIIYMINEIKILDILFIKIILSGLLYTLVIVLILLKYPEQIGIKKEILKTKIKGVLL